MMTPAKLESSKLKANPPPFFKGLKGARGFNRKVYDEDRKSFFQE